MKSKMKRRRIENRREEGLDWIGLSWTAVGLGWIGFALGWTEEKAGLGEGWKMVEFFWGR